MERTLLAIETGDRSMLLWKMLDHHEIRSYHEAEKLLEDVLDVEFNRAMNDYFRWPEQWREYVTERRQSACSAEFNSVPDSNTA